MSIKRERREEPKWLVTCGAQNAQYSPTASQPVAEMGRARAVTLAPPPRLPRDNRITGEQSSRSAAVTSADFESAGNQREASVNQDDSGSDNATVLPECYRDAESIDLRITPIGGCRMPWHSVRIVLKQMLRRHKLRAEWIAARATATQSDDSPSPARRHGRSGNRAPALQPQQSTPGYLTRPGGAPRSPAPALLEHQRRQDRQTGSAMNDFSYVRSVTAEPNSRTFGHPVFRLDIPREEWELMNEVLNLAVEHGSIQTAAFAADIANKLYEAAVLIYPDQASFRETIKTKAGK